MPDIDPKVNNGRFKKGQKPWIMGKKGYIKNPLKGKLMPEEWRKKLMKPKSVTHKLSEETKKKISDKAKLRVGSLNNRWKGGESVISNKKRIQRLKEAGGSFTSGEWELLKKQYGLTCPCCKQPEPQIKLTQDHIIPLSKGGTNFIENIQPLCLRCNMKKFTKIIKYVYE